jgi:hypothetical protein
MAVELIGPVYDDSDGNGRIVPVPTESRGLMLADIKLDRPAPYRIDLNSKIIGWAPASSVRSRGAAIFKKGLVVLVSG